MSGEAKPARPTEPSGLAGPTGLAAPAAIGIREVGPRDGLQNEAPLAPGERARLIRLLAAAGCQTIEAVSFVSERAVPAMAGAAEVLALLGDLHDAVALAALVPTAKRAAEALRAPLATLTVTISASPAYNEKNVRMSVEASRREIEAIATLAAGARTAVAVDAVVSCAFGSPFEGELVEPADVAALAASLLLAGCSQLTLADTTGVATPRRIRAVLDAVGERISPHGLEGIGLHLHDTRGTALLNAWAAMELGVRRFDTSVGGLGGSPFAPGAGGNLATEDVVAVLDDEGIETGIDLGRLLLASNEARRLVGHDLASRTVTALGVPQGHTERNG